LENAGAYLKIGAKSLLRAHREQAGGLSSGNVLRSMQQSAMATLAIGQAPTLSAQSSFFAHHPTWVGCLELARSALYVVFVLCAAAAFLVHHAPKAEDRRVTIRIVAITATFLLVVVALFFPLGPKLYSPAKALLWTALGISVCGMALALASIATLRANFSIVPEARELVVSGPYRFVRHPVYLAELTITTGGVIAYPRVVLAFAELLLIALQVVRIGAEERLLGNSFSTFNGFARATPFRLLPGIW
jgi:protein-S-isoprenylcysteine O-methyltransferase Ste14